MARKTKTVARKANIPGFDAAASIYRSAIFYQAAAGLSLGGAISPQFPNPCAHCRGPAQCCRCFGGYWDGEFCE